MKLIVKSNTSAHNFAIGTEVYPAACCHVDFHADAWIEHGQVFVRDAEGNAWWVSLDEMEISS